MRRLKSQTPESLESTTSSASVFFERMEPKVLYSADALSGLVPIDPFSNDDTSSSSLTIAQSVNILNEAFSLNEQHSENESTDSSLTPLRLEDLQTILDGGWNPEQRVDKAENVLAHDTGIQINYSVGDPDIGGFEFDGPDAPAFSTIGPFDVDEGAVVGTVVGDVDADDDNGGAADVGISYSITSNEDLDGDGNDAFSIDSSTGEISVNDSDDFDFESASSFLVTVESERNGSTSSTDVTVNVNDVAPTLSVVGATTGTAGLTNEFALRAVEPGVSGITSYTVNWGDGNITTETYTGESTVVSHVYDSVGFTYDITFSANDVNDTWTASNILVTNWVSGRDDVYIVDGNTGDVVGNFDDTNGDLRKPYGIVFGPDGNVYVAGYDSDNIVSFDRDGNYLGVFTSHNSIDKPSGLAWGSDGNLYVANYANDNILRFDSSGAFVDIWASRALFNGALDGPQDIAFGPDGNLYVSDWDDEQILVIDGELGGEASIVIGAGLESPEQLAFDGAGNLYIANTDDSNVLRWDGTSLTTYYSDSNLDYVSGITFGPDGQLYVTSYENDRIYRYDGTNSELFADDGAGGLNAPSHLTFTPDHQITIVANTESTAGNLSSTSAYNEGDASVAIDDIVVSDADAGDTISVSLELANTTTGNLSTNDGATYNATTGVWSISDSVANVNTALANVAFIPASDNDLDTTITTKVYDDSTNPSAALSGVINLNVTPINDEPVLDSIGDQLIDESSTLSFTATASDIDEPGDDLTFSLDANAIALGMSINPTTGLFTWTPTEAQGGLTPSVTVTVTDDGAGNLADSETFTITVNDINEAPTLSAIGNQSVDELVVLAFTASATDTDQPSDTLTFNLDASSIALGMGIDASTGEFTWTPTEAQGGLTPSVTITVTDNGTGNLVDSETFTITVNDGNAAPVLDTIGNQFVDELVTLAFTASATDTDRPSDTLTFSLDTNSIALGMDIDANTGDFTWTPTEAQGGLTPAVTITVTDDGTGGLIDSETFTISVSTLNVAPVLNAIGNQVVEELAMLNFTAAATDDDEPSDALTFSLDASSIALGMDIDANTGDFTWTPTEAQGGLTPSVTVTVTDDGTGDLSDSETFTISVNDNNVPPILNAIGNQSVNELSVLMFSASATDADQPENDLTFSLDVSSIALGMNIDSNTGDFSWTPTEAQGGLTPVVTVTVADDGTGELIDSETFTITVSDINVAPVLNAIGNLTIDEQATLEFAASATDTDLPIDTLVYNLDANSLALGMSIDSSSGFFNWTPTEDQGGLVPVVTLTVTDSGRLVDSETFTVTVNEVNVTPVATNLDSAVLYDEGAESVAIENIAINDDDTAEIITATLTLANTGLGSLSENDGATYTASSGVWTITDTVTNVNTALAELTFIPLSDNDLNTFITVVIDDGDEDSSGALTGSIALDVTPINDAPILEVIDDQTIDELVILSLSASASDIDQPADNLTYSLDVDSLALGMSIDPTTGEFSWTPTEEQGGESFSVILSVADDGTGNLLDSQVFTIAVNDTIVPPVLAAANDQNVDEDLTVEVVIPEAVSLVEAVPENSNDEAPNDDPVISEPIAEVVVNEDIPIILNKDRAPAANTENDTTINNDAPEVRGIEYGKNEIRELTALKPSGLTVLISKLNQQLDFFDDPLQLVSQNSFSTKLNEMREEMITDSQGTEKIIGNSLSVTAGLSGGYVIWLVRSGVLLSSALSSLPTWRFIDPLPVLSGSWSDTSDEDDDSLESMVTEERDDESNVEGSEN